MTWAAYAAHLAEGERMLNQVGVSEPPDERTKALCAIAHFLAALAAVEDPNAGMPGAETEEALTTQN